LAGEKRQERLEPVGAVNEGEAALRTHHGEGETHPRIEPRLALDIRGRLARIGWRRRLAGGEEGRGRPGGGGGAGRESGGRLQEVATHEDDTLRHVIQRGVVGGEADELELLLDAGDAALGKTRREAERRSAGTAPDIEDLVGARGRHRCGEEY